jgi:hypothetical protein
MFSLVVALLIGCSPEPASIKFAGEPTQTVHTMAAVPVNKATVLDKTGKAIEPQPKLDWKANPDTVASIDAAKGMVTPKANGEATIEASVGTVKGNYKFVVAMPDKVEIAGYTAGSAWPVGQAAQLTANVKAGDAMVDGQTVTWESSNPAVATVDAQGNVMGVSEGTATIKATAGTLTSSTDVTIGGAPAMAADAGAAPTGAMKK